ncbi:MAG: pyridoxamine 5'-phosphate oxidase family protein [Tepidisphaeraceae bacterium]
MLGTVNPHDVPSLAETRQGERSLEPSAILDECWRMLDLGVRDRRSPLHTPTLATVALDGRPALRTVVLRRVERPTYELFIHTDLRSPKVTEVKREPRVAVCLYDPTSQTQLRIDARATVHAGDDAIAQQQWDRSHPMSRECYRTPVAPSSAIDGPDAIGAMQVTGREQFAVLRCVVDRIEWLWLRHDGHRRLRFDLRNSVHEWLAP